MSRTRTPMRSQWRSSDARTFTASRRSCASGRYRSMARGRAEPGSCRLGIEPSATALGAAYARHMAYRRLHLGDGFVEYIVDGPEDARDLLIFHVGTPSAAVRYDGLVRAAGAAGIRVA